MRPPSPGGEELPRHRDAAPRCSPPLPGSRGSQTIRPEGKGEEPLFDGVKSQNHETPC